MLSEPDSAPYKTIDGLERGLIILRELNRRRGATVNELHHATSINRTSIYRILVTLGSMGYVVRNRSEGRFYTTRNSLELSDGYDDDAWVVEVCSPELERLNKKIVWPCDIVMLEGDSMVVRESTFRTSPLSIYRSNVGSRWPIGSTASGRAYLSFCSERERTELVQLLRNSRNPRDSMLQSDRFLNGLVETTRAAGYGSSVKEVNHNISAISLPIRHRDRVLACLSLIYVSKAMSIVECAEKFLGEMQASVDSIEKSLADWNAEELYIGAVPRIRNAEAAATA